MENFEFPRLEDTRLRCRQSGWVLKAPFTTNSKGIKYCPNIYDILTAFEQFCNSLEHSSIPFFILQPRMTNRLVVFKYCLYKNY